MLSSDSSTTFKMNGVCKCCGGENVRVCGMDEKICPNCGFFPGQDTVDLRLAWTRATHLLEWAEKFGR